MRINTSLTRLLNIRVPVLCAPMAGAGGGKLASQVTLGGGFGFMAAVGYNSSTQLRDELNLAKSFLKVESPSILPIGVGYLAWKLEESESTASDMLDAALDNHVQAIWLAFGTKIGKWVEYVRQADTATGGTRKTLIFVLVNSLQEALVAANEWKADVLVAQGSESGGHGGGYAPSVFSLVSSILAAIPKDGPLVVAAGGLATGAQIASFLTLGVSGAALGTRFLLTPESYYSGSQKKALIIAGAESTVRTLAFDHARNTLGWPAGIDGRGLRNIIVEDFEKGVSHDVLNQKLKEGVESGNPDRMITWAGQGVGEMKEIRGAQAIVHDLEKGIIEQLQRQQILLDE